VRQDFAPSEAEKLASAKLFQKNRAVVEHSNRMAPQNQQNGAVKRKRPTDAPAAGKKEKLADRANKKVKTSRYDKPAPAKKPSNTPPVAPLTVSKLKGPGKEEAAFPRGGGSVLTPLEYKEVTNLAVKDVLFETRTGSSFKSGERGSEGDVDMGGEGRKPKHKKRIIEYAKKDKKKEDTKKEEDTGPKVEGLSFKVRDTQSIR